MKRRIVWLKEEWYKLLLATLWQLMHTHIDGVRTYWRGMKLLVTSAPLFATASLVLLGLFSIVPVMQVWLMQQLIDLLSAPLHLADRHAGTLDGTVLILFAVLCLFTLGGLLLLLVHIHPVLPLVLLLVGAPYLRARQRMEGEKYRSMTDHTRVAREMEYYTRLALEPTVAHEVRIF